MHCQKCRFDNPGGMIFCGKCGSRLGAVCPVCGRLSPAFAAACAGCGATMPPSDTPPGHSEEAAERKYVSLFFSDLSGYTAMSLRLPPEKVKEIMSAVFGSAAEIVKRHGGVIDKFIGDAVLAIFGIPAAHEDDPARAVTAALELHGHVAKTASRLSAETGTPLFLHTGIHTGFVVTGEMERKRRGVTGAAVNLASRITGLAGRGEILVSETTRLLSEKSFSFEALPPATVKGITEPVAVHKVLAPLPQGAGSQGGRPEAPFIGRETFLACLKEAVRKLTGEGKGGLVIISGEAGIGKSRLAAEAERVLTAGSLRWFSGTAHHKGEYGPFVEVLKASVGISGETDDGRALSRLRHRLNLFFSDEAFELLPLFSCLAGLICPASLPGEQADPGARRQRHLIFTAVRRFFAALAENTPLVVQLEDLHLADSSTLDLLGHLLPLCGVRPLLFIVTRRRGRDEFFLKLSERAGKGNVTEITLPPLAPAEAKELAGILLARFHLPMDATPMVLERAEGNPLFIAEMVRTLKGRKGAAGADGDPSPLPMPDTLRGLILERLDRLEPGQKQVMKAAAVIGRLFSFSILARVLEKEPEPRLYDRLAELSSTGFLKAPSCRNEQPYAFSNGFLHEAVYETLTTQERRRLHLSVAGALCSEGQLRHLPATGTAAATGTGHEILAFHYSRARVWDKAFHHLFRAGMRADSLAADATALARYREAMMARMRSGGGILFAERAVVERKMGEALFRLGEHRQAADCFLRALSLQGAPLPAGTTGIRLAIAKALCRQLLHRLLCLGEGERDAAANFISGQPEAPDPLAAVEPGNTPEMIRLLEGIAWIDYFLDRERMLLAIVRMLNLAESRNDPEAQVRAGMGMGMILGSLGRFGLAQIYNRRAMALAGRFERPAMTALCQLFLAIHDDFRARWDAAIDAYGRAAQIYREVRDMRRWGTAVFFSAFLHIQKGRFDQGIILCREVFRVGQEGDDPQLQGWGRHGEGFALLCRGDMDNAAAALKAAVKFLSAVPDTYDGCLAAAQLARCLLAQGDIKRAKPFIESCRRMLSTASIKGPKVAFAGAALAECCLLLWQEERQGHWRAAAGSLARLSLSTAKRFPGALPHALRVTGALHHLFGRTIRAKRTWRKGLSAAERLGAPWEAAQIHLAIGRHSGDAFHLLRAASLLSDLGADDHQ